MKNEYCAGCSFSRKITRKTKPMLFCSYGRYKEEPNGYPCSWIKKCEYHDRIRTGILSQKEECLK